MFLCVDCGKEFEELTVFVSNDDNLPKSAYSRCGCPFCGSMDVMRDIGKCDECGRLIYPPDRRYKLVNSLQVLFCEDCMERIN